MIVHSHISAAGSLEGFVLLLGRRVPWSVSLILAQRDPKLLEAILAKAALIARAVSSRNAPLDQGSRKKYEFAH